MIVDGREMTEEQAERYKFSISLEEDRIKMMNEPIYCVNCTKCVGYSDEDNENVSICCEDCKP